MTKWLELDFVERICFKLIIAYRLDDTEPVPPFNTRYSGRLEACLLAPRQTFRKKLLYPTLVDQAAILFYLLSKDHPFQNGNKRIALVSLLVFLLLNGKWLRVGLKRLYTFSVEVAKSDAREKDKELRRVKRFIRRHMIKAPKIRRQPAK